MVTVFHFLHKTAHFFPCARCNYINGLPLYKHAKTDLSNMINYISYVGLKSIGAYPSETNFEITSV